MPCVEFGRLMYHMAHGGEAAARHDSAGPHLARAQRPQRHAEARQASSRVSARERFHALYKLMTMSSADYLDEWFEFGPLKATKSASGIIGTFLGPRSPGSAYVLLHHYMGEIDGAFRAWGFCARRQWLGEPAPSRAPRGRSARTIRTEAPVKQLLVKDGRATGVVLENGDEISRARRRVRPRRAPHVSRSRRAARSCRTSSLAQVRRFRFRGSSGKVNLALSELPEFTCMPGIGQHHRGAFSISPSVDYLERAYDDAKYGEFSRKPYMDIVFPSMIDPNMAPPGKHVASIFVQYAPYHIDGGWTDAKREAFGDAVIDTLSEYAPNLKSAIVRPAGAHARGHRAHHRSLRRQHLSGRARASAAVLPASRRALGQLSHADPRLLPVRRRARHPGGGVMGAAGRLAALRILADT